MQNTIEHLNPVDIFTLMDDGEEIVLIDVREPSEYIGDMGHIPSSLNVPVSSLEKFLNDQNADREKKIVFVCATGERSLYACNIALRYGFRNPVNLRGGMVQWHLSGLEVVYDD